MLATVAKARRALTGPVTRQGRLGPALVGALTGGDSVGRAWAPTNYANYYLTSSPVYAAVKKRAEAVVRPRLQVLRVGRDGEKVEVEYEHPLAALFRKVNPFWTRSDLWRMTSLHLDLWGAAYWWVEKPSRDPATWQLWALRPDRMRIVVSERRYIVGYEYEHEGVRQALLPDEVVWFRHLNPTDEFGGLAPIAPLRLAADMGLDALRHNRNQFLNGMLFGQVAISSRDSDPTDEDLDDFYARLKKRFATPERSGLPLVLNAGMDAKNLGFSPRDMEHLATLRWSVEEVARVYDVPLVLLQDLSHATYENIATAEKMFWRSIAGYLSFLAEEVNEMLCPQFGPDIEIAFDLSDIEALQPDADAVSTRLIAQVQAGIRTHNEARAELGLDPVPWGDAWWAPLSVLPVESVEDGRDEEDVSAPGGPATENAYRYRRWTPPALTDAALERLGTLHVRRLDRHERRFDRVQRDLFEAQRRDVLQRLRSVEAARAFVAGAVEKQVPGEPLFDAREWIERFLREGSPLIAAALQDAGTAQVAEFGLGIAFDVANPRVQEAIAARAGFWADAVNTETARLLTQELAEGQAAGEGLRDLQARVEKVFQFGDAVRSERIARTEMNWAANEGALASYEQSGVVEQVRWLATLDDRVRDAHAVANGQTVALGAPFLVGGESVRHPGEGSPANSIACRCTVTPVVGRGMRRAMAARRMEAR